MSCSEQKRTTENWLFCIILVILLVDGTSCPNYETAPEAETACSGSFSLYPINGTKLPYICSSCGSGLICGNNSCPPILERSQWLSTPCPEYVSEQFDCASIQKFCEDSGNGYLIFAKAYIYLAGSQYKCSGCSGNNNIFVPAELTQPDPDNLLEPPYNSAIMVLIYIAIALLYISGLMIEHYGRVKQDELGDGYAHGKYIANREIRILFALVDSKGNQRSICDAIWQSVVLLRFVRSYCCCCIPSSKRSQFEYTESEKLEESRFVTSYVISTISVGLGISYLLNSLSLVYMGCKTSYELVQFSPSGTLDPFTFRSPDYTLTTWPIPYEDFLDIFTIFDKSDTQNQEVNDNSIIDIIIEELIFLLFISSIDKFLRGCAQMKAWDQKRIHTIVRLAVILFGFSCVVYQQINFQTFDLGLVLSYVFANFLLAVLLLTILLPIFASIRWIVGMIIISFVSTSVKTGAVLAKQVSSGSVQKMISQRSFDATDEAIPVPNTSTSNQNSSTL